MSSSELVSIRQLLKDPVYLAWAKRPPDVQPGTRPPWTLYVQIRGRWMRMVFDTYPYAWNWLAKRLKLRDTDGSPTIQNAAICCSPRGFRPPRVKDPTSRRGSRVWDFSRNAPDHEWCPFCRRPTLFLFYPKGKHPAMPGRSVIPYLARCCICGVSRDFARKVARGK